MTRPRHTLSPELLRRFGSQVDFGRTAEDYVAHRAGFPAAFFERLQALGYVQSDQTALDLGPGTGSVARGLAGLGLQVTGLDPSTELMEQAKKLDTDAGVSVRYLNGTAESTGLQSGSYDLITAGQCWHWFNRDRTASECTRLLRPGGRLLIAHFDWLPLPGNVVAATEELILRYNPGWAGAGGSGIYPEWLTDLSGAGFGALETMSFDLKQPYSHRAWRGRIRASAGCAASLKPESIDHFDRELADMLTSEFPQTPLAIPHRVWFATGVFGGADHQS